MPSNCISSRSRSRQQGLDSRCTESVVTCIRRSTNFSQTLEYGYQDLSKHSYTDLVIIADSGHSFRIHRLLLCAASPFISNILDNTLTISPEHTLCLPDIPSGVVSALCQLLYGSAVILCKSDIEHLNHLIQMLQITLNICAVEKLPKDNGSSASTFDISRVVNQSIVQGPSNLVALKDGLIIADGNDSIEVEKPENSRNIAIKMTRQPAQVGEEVGGIDLPLCCWYCNAEFSSFPLLSEHAELAHGLPTLFPWMKSSSAVSYGLSSDKRPPQPSSGASKPLGTLLFPPPPTTTTQKRDASRSSLKASPSKKGGKTKSCGKLNLAAERRHHRCPRCGEIVPSMWKLRQHLAKHKTVKSARKGDHPYSGKSKTVRPQVKKQSGDHGYATAASCQQTTDETESEDASAQTTPSSNHGSANAATSAVSNLCKEVPSSSKSPSDGTTKVGSQQACEGDVSYAQANLSEIMSSEHSYGSSRVNTEQPSSGRSTHLEIKDDFSNVRLKANDEEVPEDHMSPDPLDIGPVAVKGDKGTQLPASNSDLAPFVTHPRFIMPARPVPRQSASTNSDHMTISSNDKAPADCLESELTNEKPPRDSDVTKPSSLSEGGHSDHIYSALAQTTQTATSTKVLGKTEGESMPACDDLTATRLHHSYAAMDKRLTKRPQTKKKSNPKQKKPRKRPRSPARVTETPFNYIDLRDEGKLELSQAIKSSKEEVSADVKLSNSRVTRKPARDSKKSNYPCHQCSKVFPAQFRLNRHVREVHNKEKLHKCPQCGKGFFKSNSLRRHVITVHENLKLYVCELCQKTFKDHTCLRYHRDNRVCTSQRKGKGDLADS